MDKIKLNLKPLKEKTKDLDAGKVHDLGDGILFWRPSKDDYDALLNDLKIERR